MRARALLAAAAFFPVVGNGLIDGDDRVLFLDAVPQMQAPPVAGRPLGLHRDARLLVSAHATEPRRRGARRRFGRLGAPPRQPAAARGNAALLFLSCGRDRQLFRSLVAAALFAVHPIQTESVAWVVQRSTVLSAALAFLTVGAHVRFARRPTLGRRAAVAALFTLGLMAKPILVTLPLVLLLGGLLAARPIPGPRRRPGRPEPAGARAPAWRLLAEKAPLLAIPPSSR